MSAQNEFTDHATASGYGRVLSRALAVAFAVFGFLPIANWISGGHVAPWYWDVLQTWIFGSAIVAGIVVVLIIVTRRRILSVVCKLGDDAARWFERAPHRTAIIVSLVAAGVYALVSWLVFDARPLFIDEIVQVYQARLFATGVLTERVGPFPEFFGALNVVSVGDRQFGQFPPGGPAHLLLGVLVGAPWLATPLLGGGAVYVFARLVRRIEPEAPVALGATLLLAFSPFMIFMSASHMNHVPTMLWVLVAWLACVRLTSREGAPMWWAALFGVAIGIAGSIRPVDAIAMTAPAVALWALSLRRRAFKWREMLATAGGLAVPGILILAYNAATTGDPFLFGYDLMWGKTHSLGFHQSPWGPTHTPARGMELVNLYGLRLQSYLFESPAPSLLPIIATLAVAQRISRIDRALLWTILLLVAAYFAYWHDGFYLGPRFVFVLVPLLALLAARAPRALGALTARSEVRRVSFVGLATAFILGVGLGFPDRARFHSQSLTNARHRLTAPVDSTGTQGALIFVRESWGSQVLARLWGRAIERPDAEFLYRHVDTCVLDSALAVLEAHDVSGPAARSGLWALLRDSTVVQPSTLSPDRSERVVPGKQYSSHCLQQIADDIHGTALYPVLLAERRGSNVYARDLGERNAVLASRYPQRAAYLLTPVALNDSVYVLSPLLLHRARVTDK